MVREELEAALAASFDRATLAVYGDHLQSIGDPRGELIAIDLHVAEHGPDAQLAARKRSLAGTWLGREYAGWVAVENGFLALRVTATTEPAACALLAGPLARYVRSIAIAHLDPEAMLAAIAEAELPWLHRLELPRSPDDIDRARQVIATLPGGVAIVVAPPQPWPPPHTMNVTTTHNVLSIEIPGDPFGEDVDLRGAAELMDRDFDGLSEAARTAWLELWETLVAFRWSNSVELTFPIVTLAAALAPLVLDDFPSWRDLRIALADRRDGDVTIRGQWGW